MALSLVMVFTLLPLNGLISHAEEEPYQGLVFVNPDWDNDCEMPENPEYFNDIEWITEGARSTFYMGVLGEEGEFTPIEDPATLTISNSEKVIIEPNESEKTGLYDISFSEPGTYTVSNGDTKVTIIVNASRIKLYADDDCLDEFERDDWGNYIWGDNRPDLFEAYIKITPNGDERLVDALYVQAEERGCIDAENFMDEDGICITKLEAENLYKITRDERPRDYEIRLAVDGIFENEEGKDFQDLCQELGICFRFDPMGEDPEPCFGLVFADPDWDNDYAIPEFPNYFNNLDWPIEGNSFTFYIGVLSEEGEFTPVDNLKSLTISDLENIIIEPNEHDRPGLYDFSFIAPGTYTISNGETEISITVSASRIKLYSNEACTDELDKDEWGSYLWGDEYHPDVFEAYIKISPNEDEELVDALFVQARERVCVDGTTAFDEDGIYVEKLETPNTYKITRTAGRRDYGIGIAVDFVFENENGELIHDLCQDINICFSFHLEEGLVATDGLDIDWATGEVMGIYPDAPWNKEMWSDINGFIAEFDITMSGDSDVDGEVDPRNLKIYDAEYDEDDNLIVSEEESQTAFVGPYGDSTCFAEVRFSMPGTYVVSYVPEGKEEVKDLYRVVIHVDYPLMGWYTKPELAGEAIISGDYAYTKENGDDVIYFIIKDSEDNRLKEDYEPFLLCGDMANQLSNSAICGVEEYVGDVEGAAKVYKLTLKSKMRIDIAFEPTFEWYEWLDWEQRFEYREDIIMRASLCISYIGEDPIDAYEGDIIRYTGEDGTDWVGFSGCFISKESYETGQTWFKGRYPEGICYYVHARTIQEVVDKLLDVAGKKVMVWDDLEGRDKEIVIPNTGYIELNMSYRDASYEETVQTEQYVYAPASIKGILMNAANNPYMIQRKNLDGTPIYMNEDGEGDDIKCYDDVIEFPLTEEAKAAGKGIAKSVDGDNDSENLDTVFGIRLQMDESTEAGFNEETIGKLKEMVVNAGGSWTCLWDLDQSDSQQPILIQKTVYNSSKGAWETVDYFYTLASEDIAPNEWGDEQTVFNCSSVLQPPHHWPSLHVNASTQVRVQGLWIDDAELYIGFFEGQDEVYTDAYDTRFTSEDIGTTKTVRFELGTDHVFNYETGKFETGNILASDVVVHVVKAESNTNIADTYSEGEQKAEIIIQKEAISDFVPMTDEEIQTIIDGGVLDVDMSISKIDNTEDADVSEAVSNIEAEIEKVISDSQIDYIELDIDYKIKSNNGHAYGASKKITETNEPIVISVPMNESMKEKKNYYVYRYHDGKVEKLPAWIDEETGNLCFETDKFSTYAIAGEEATPDEFVKVQAYLAEQIALDFKVYIPEELVEKAQRMEFDVEGEKQYVSMEDAEQEVIEGRTCYVFRCVLNSTQMKDIIIAKMIYSDETIGETKAYSIEEYLEKLTETYHEDAELMSLVDSMATFGDCMKAYETNDMEHIPGVDLTQEEKDYADSYSLDSTGINTDDVIDSITPSKVRVNMGSLMSVKVKYVCDEEADYTFFVGGQQVAATKIVGEDGKIYYDVASHNIAPADYDKTIVFTAKLGDNEENYLYSPMKYAINAAEVYSDNGGYVSMFNSIIKYHYSAMKYKEAERQ